MESVLPVLACRISPVYEGFELFYKEFQVVVAEEVVLAEPLAPGILLQLGRIEVEYILGEVLPTTMQFCIFPSLRRPPNTSSTHHS